LIKLINVSKIKLKYVAIPNTIYNATYTSVRQGKLVLQDLNAGTFTHSSLSHYCSMEEPKELQGDLGIAAWNGNPNLHVMRQTLAEHSKYAGERKR